MFDVQGTNIILSRGDTGAMRLHASATRRDTGAAFTFGEIDRAVFSIKTSQGQLVREKAYQMINNAFVVVFTNQDTEQLTPGSGYTWDVRYVIHPLYSAENPPPAGTWTDYADLTFPVAANTKCKHNGNYYFAKQAIETSEEWTQAHWANADYRMPDDGYQVITPKTPMDMQLLTVVGEV